MTAPTPPRTPPRPGGAPTGNSVSTTPAPSGSVPRWAVIGPVGTAAAMWVGSAWSWIGAWCGVSGPVGTGLSPCQREPVRREHPAGSTARPTRPGIPTVITTRAAVAREPVQAAQRASTVRSQAAGGGRTPARGTRPTGASTRGDLAEVTRPRTTGTTGGGRRGDVPPAGPTCGRPTVAGDGRRDRWETTRDGTAWIGAPPEWRPTVGRVRPV